ncbi:MAG TPA: hypothetical protein VGM13_06030 [Thermoanaerobaculia bacterium]|jgi:type I restriction enzyme R subunit
MGESEKVTRWKRVDPLLKAAGWKIVDFKEGLDFKKLTKHAVREFPTSNGPADYALFVDGQILGIVEAKKVTLGPQGVLQQAERYSKGASDGPIGGAKKATPGRPRATGLSGHYSVTSPCRDQTFRSGF